ncbi:MAG TPA: tetratricopeptide repeat protein [Bryobacteraceae bacterium]|nr:tetratricopeptide repeat protein [Bryobacteraceae bacterium]
MTRNLLLFAALFAATWLVYAQTAQFDFVNYDDPDYVTNNPHVRNGITFDGVRWAFTSTEAANWFPLTRLSHMLDVQLFGLQGGWHHLVNALIHACAVLLLFAFWNAATGARWPAAFVALLFAIHPLHVESVAWVSERKDVLCAFFWFLALWAYVRGRWPLLIAAFCLGLMSKPMIVTLPFVLLLLDVWPLRRGIRIREKLPLFALAAAAAIVTWAVQAASGAVKPAGAVAIANALVSYGSYLAGTFWPSRLAVFYPYPDSLPAWQPAVSALVLAGITVAALWMRRSRPYLLVGWLWFLGTLVPVIGLVQVGAQARADRYMYVPMVGVTVMIAWGAADLLRGRRRAQAALASVALVACAGAAWAQAGYWQNSETLFAHAIQVTAGNYIAEHNLGTYLMQAPGRLEEAIPHLQEAARLRPESGQVHSDLGSALARIPGRLPDAIAELQMATRLLPDSAIPHNNLAGALTEAGRFSEAIAEYQAALRIDPGYEDARRNLPRAQAQMRYAAGLELAHAGNPLKAVAEFEEAVRIRPDFAEAHNNLGVVLSQMPGRQSDAIAHFREAVRIRPDYDDARYNLQVALQEAGQSR